MLMNSVGDSRTPLGEGCGVLAGLRGARNDLVVDIRKIAHVLHLQAPLTERPVQHVEGNVHPRVPCSQLLSCSRVVLDPTNAGSLWPGTEASSCTSG